MTRFRCAAGTAQACSGLHSKVWASVLWVVGGFTDPETITRGSDGNLYWADRAKTV